MEHASTPSAVADRYFECVRSHDLEGLVALFAKDAILILPDGRELIGVDAIRAMYQHLVNGSAPTPWPTAAIVGSNDAAVEIESHLPDGAVRRTANFFHFDVRGRIARLSVYKRGEF